MVKLTHLLCVITNLGSCYRTRALLDHVVVVNYYDNCGGIVPTCY